MGVEITSINFVQSDVFAEYVYFSIYFDALNYTGKFIFTEHNFSAN